MPPGLELQLAPGTEADPRVGAVELLLDDQMAPAHALEGHLRQILVARLQPRPLQVRRAWVFEHAPQCAV
jgi:hypothetical protein